DLVTSPGSPKVRTRSHPDPAATTPRTASRATGLPSSSIPFTTSCTVPSPPTATRNRLPSRRASRANRVASPGPSVRSSRQASPRAWSVRSSSGISSPTRRLPAWGFTITVSSPKGLAIAGASYPAPSDARVGNDAAIDGFRRATRETCGLARRGLRDLSQEVEHLLAVAHEVARSEVGLGEHVLERLALGPVEHRGGEPGLELATQLDVVGVLGSANPPVEVDQSPVALGALGGRHLPSARNPLPRLVHERGGDGGGLRW